MDSSAQQRLTLKQSQCQELQTFFTTQIALRKSLSKQHKEEHTYLKFIREIPCECAKVIFRQACEITEFGVLHSDKKWCIRKGHNDATLALERLLK